MTPTRSRRTAVSLYHEASRLAAAASLVTTTQSFPRSGLAVVANRAWFNGISRGGELQHHEFRRSGVESTLVDVADVSARTRGSTGREAASTYVFHAAAPETSLLLRRVLPQAAEAWRVGYWAWELPDPPPGWERYQSLVSEIWTPSSFSARALSSTLSLPVRVVPHRVPPRTRRERDPRTTFTVVAIADSRSSFARKNPVGAIDAFQRAFGLSPRARLLLKVAGSAADLAPIRARARSAPNIELRMGRLTDEEMADLYRSSDVLLSLHRAEGFGLPMLEAMSHGVPVVATGWSGNCDFMSERDSVLVPFTLVPVDDRSGVYRLSSLWAEPDIDEAAAALRRLAADDAAHDALARAPHEAVGALPASALPEPSSTVPCMLTATDHVSDG